MQSQKKMYQCEQCEWTSNYSTSIRRHIEAEHESVKYQCTICPKKIKWGRRNLQEHMDRKHGSKHINCDQCEFISSSQTILRKHQLQVHERRYMKRCNCSICGASFVSKESRDRHWRYIHEGLKRVFFPGEFACGICVKVFNRKSNCDAHKRRQHR